MRKVYTNVNILDGTANMQLQTNMAIEVVDGKIVSIKEAKEVSGNDVVDLKGKYVIPGLINLHIHTPGTGFPKKKESDPKKIVGLMKKLPPLMWYGKALCKSAVQTELLSGTTTVRTVGGLFHIDSSIRDDIKNGKYAGPRILTSDQAITIPGGHMEGSVAVGAISDEEYEAFIENNVKHGVDWIKIMITGGVLDAKVKGEPGVMKMNDQQVKVCCEKAHALGLKVCAHVESPEGIICAINNGVDSIEHGSLMSEETAKLFIEKNATLTCTLSPAIPLAKFADEVAPRSEIVKYNSEVLLENIIKGTKTALAAGVKVGLGTDTVCPYITHYDMWRELEYYHRLIGVTRAYALHTATLINAEILGVQDVTGSIEVGKYAEFIVVDNNPLDGFDTIRNPYMVVCQHNEFVKPKIKKNAICEQELDKVLYQM